MSGQNSCVAVYDFGRQLGEALDALQGCNCDMRMVSAIGRGGDSARRPFAFYDTATGVRFCGERADFWNGLAVLLGAAACLWSAREGPLVATGAIVPVMAASDGRLAIAGNLGLLGRALYTQGVSADSALRYETMVGAGRLLLVVQGDRQDVERASEALAATDGVDMAMYAA